MGDRAKTLELQIRNPSHLSWNHHSHSHSHSYTHTVAIITQASCGLVAKERKTKKPKVAEHWVAIRPAWVRLELEQVQLEWEMLQEMVAMNRRRTLRQHCGYKNKIKIIKKTTAERCSKLTTAVAAAETAVAAKFGARPQSRPS